MINAVDKGFIAFISQNKNTFYTFLILSLIAANVYQYVKGAEDRSHYQAEEKMLNEIIRKRDEETIKYERERIARLDFLLNTLTPKK